MYYEIILWWSYEDACFVADVPELPGCMAHGESYETALKEVQFPIELWVAAAREFGDEIPVPRGTSLVFA